MTYLLAIDPSVRSVGAALFEAGELLDYHRIVPIAPPRVERGARCLLVAREIASWSRTGGSIKLVFEWPQVYRAAKSKGDPNDLIGLAGVGCALAGILRPIEVTTPTPAEWIGQVPKTVGSRAPRSEEAWLTPRGRMVRRALMPAEVTRVSAGVVNHDVVDAIGLGLWRLGRLRRRVLPGTT